MFKNKILMITGGTGSFGKSVLDRFLHSEFAEIRIFSRDEEKQEKLRVDKNNSKLKFYIGDVRDYDSIYEASKDVDYIFHAAALKQVPSCEFYPLEAYKTNVLGSENLMNAALARKVKKVVMLSTDKAVYPVNAMGISKAMMEKCMIAKSRRQNDQETIFCATRYGNVLASRGSVIPLFLTQIKLNKPITITDSNMSRFFMTLEESVNLVLFAFEFAQQGDIFVQKSPAFTIGNLAEALASVMNKKIQINIIGTRHGEKLYESLISREEMTRIVEYAKFYGISPDNRDLNYESYFTQGEEKITAAEDYTSHNTKRLSVDEIRDVLLNLPIIQDAINA